MPSKSLIEEIFALFGRAGAAAYFGEQVSQLEHALQAATLAEQSGASDELVTAALLHDVGHLLQDGPEDLAIYGVDTWHEAIGADWLEVHFGQDIAMPVRLHVDAKRYLCSREPGYRISLSPASRLTLELQGGAMSEAEAAAFEMNPYRDAALMIRRWDDGAKREGVVTPDLVHFRPYMERVLLARRSLPNPVPNSTSDRLPRPRLEGRPAPLGRPRPRFEARVR